MLKHIKIMIIILLLNIVIINNNIKENYNIIDSKMKFHKKGIDPMITTNTSTKNIKNKTNKKNKIDNINNITLEVQQNWVNKKEDEILQETSIFRNITQIIKKKLENISLRPNTIHLVIKYVMELIEETPIKGVEQKELALKIMRELFKDITEGEDEIVLLKLLDDGSISNIIELVVDATNGKIDVNTAITTSVNCITTCLPYCMRSNNSNKLKKLK